MQRYFLQLCYKGTNYCGWQIQNNAVSVQQIVNSALEILICKPTETVGCGRTDTGVHASDFYLHFDTESEIKDEKEFIYRINKILPKDIAVIDLIKVKADANARFDALSRTYEYHIMRQKDPFLNQLSWYYYADLDIDKMNEACLLLFNHHDFTSFSKTHSQTKTNICKIMLAKWEQQEHLLVFTIRADRFLRNMVRAIVGTLIKVGAHEITLTDFENIIKNKDRKEAGMSVPAKGLYLVNVEYDFENIEE